MRMGIKDLRKVLQNEQIDTHCYSLDESEPITLEIVDIRQTAMRFRSTNEGVSWIDGFSRRDFSVLCIFESYGEISPREPSEVCARIKHFATRRVLFFIQKEEAPHQ